ncbi:MAG: PspC domain-containing protein [Candidatus Altiarchaeota archaeon]|nr:PspC domain-containing protein [Candidatus Altiarchaeota archaeon]
MAKKKVKRIYRSNKDRVLGGVCGGVADYVGTDPSLVRLMWILGSFLWPPGLSLYFIAWLIVPRNPKHKWN